MNAVEELLRGHVRGCREAGEEYARRLDALEALIDDLSKRPEPDLRCSAIGWSAEENELLRRNYPLHGSRLCADMLPHRTYEAVRGHIGRLGLQRMPPAIKVLCDQCSERKTRGQIVSCQSKFCPKGKLVG